jgi:hypothetical protein
MQTSDIEENDKRAETARDCLDLFMKQTGCDPESALADLLANLAHWCDRNDTDFESELRKAASHYADETDGRGAQLDDISTPPL